MFQTRQRNFCRIKKHRVRPEPHGSARVLPADLTDLVQTGDFFAVPEGEIVFLATAPHPDFELLRQGIYHRHTDTVQATCKLVVLAGELAAGVQPGEDHFCTGHPFFRVNVHRHPPAVILYLHRSILEYRDFYLAGIAGNGLIDAIVDHFLGEMIGTRGIGVHPGAFAHRIKSAEHFDRSRIVFTGHGELNSK